MTYSFFLAYIDPGTGSFMLQMLIAGVVGAIAYFRNAFFSLFRRNKNKESLPEEPPPSPSGPESTPNKATAAATSQSGPTVDPARPKQE